MDVSVLFSKQGIKTNRLYNLEFSNFEVLWVQIRPVRLPRGFPCLVAATIYHPPIANDKDMLEYLLKSLIEIEGHFLGCVIIIADDFNQSNIHNLCRQFNLKQLVHIPTRGSNVLDFVLTNLHSFYKSNSILFYPPFGLSDHCTITIQPKQKQSKPSYQRITYRRDTRPSHKAMFGRYISQID